MARIFFREALSLFIFISWIMFLAFMSGYSSAVASWLADFTLIIMAISSSSWLKFLAARFRLPLNDTAADAMAFLLIMTVGVLYAIFSRGLIAAFSIVAIVYCLYRTAPLAATFYEEIYNSGSKSNPDQA